MSPDEREAGDLSVSMAPRLGAPRKERLNELLALAQAYRGWAMKDLARFLGRDPHNIIPDSGVPKLDLVVRLAEALDWPVASVVEDLCNCDEPPTRAVIDEAFAELNREAYRAHVEGRHQDQLRLAHQALSVARTPDERLQAAIREYCAWDGLGRYGLALQAAQRGLAEGEGSPSARMVLQSNLANCYYSLGQALEGEGLATTLLASLDSSNTPLSTDDQATRAFARYVRGSCRRLRAIQETASRAILATSALSDLDRAAAEWESFAKSVGQEPLTGVSHTCRGGSLVAAVLLGKEDPLRAIDTIAHELESVTDVAPVTRGDWLESYGWWAIFGCEIAASDVVASHGERCERALAVFTNKAYEIAERLDHWALRERAFRYEFALQKRRTGLAGASADTLVLDREDIRVLSGTMGRFPGFRDLGWTLLRPTGGSSREVH